MKQKCLLLFLCAMPSCASMNESLQFGAGAGALAGGAATYVAYSSTGTQPKFEDVALGAGIGLSLGLITSYFTHKNVEQDRRDGNAYQTDMYFGDLPPSPFIFQKQTPKRGGK